MLFPVTAAEQDARESDSGEEDDEGSGVRSRDLASDEESCADEEVEDPLEDIGYGRGPSEGCREWFSADAFDEARHAACEGRSGEEAQDVREPVQEVHRGVHRVCCFPNQ